MANHKSAIKRHRQNLKKRDHNREIRAAVRLALKKARTAVIAKDAEAPKLVVAAESAIARAAVKGLYHKSNAARKIGRLKKFATATGKK